MGIKKLALNLVLGAALVIAPLSASALTPMSDNNMKDVTGQAGVSIGLDNIVIYQSIGETKYIDEDGWGHTNEGNLADHEMGSEGAIVISDKEVLKQFNAILDGGTYGVNQTLSNGRTFGYYGAGIVANNEAYLTKDSYDATYQSTYATEIANAVDPNNPTSAEITAAMAAANTAGLAATTEADIENPFDGTTAAQAAGADNTTGISPLTIDIGECMALTKGFQFNATDSSYMGGALAAQTITGVVIGLPTIEIITSGDTYSVGIEGAGVNSGNDFIKIEKSDATMAILGGRLEIAAH